MQFVWCPPGQFMMGSPETEPGRRADERQHEEQLTKGFYLSRYLVSIQQSNITTGERSPDSLMDNEPGYLKRAKTFLTWNDAIVFCRQLTSLPTERSAGRLYRLPTEAEWEYACRAGTTTQFYFGDDPERWVAYSYMGESALSRPLGLKVANPWGFYDMGGGIGEWCQDWYEPLPAVAQVDPRGPNQGDQKVIRGGFRSARRQTSSGPNLRSSGTGLRLVVEIPELRKTHN
jgi:formylglycine-generating enzyme required for sulfatase activity